MARVIYNGTKEWPNFYAIPQEYANNKWIHEQRYQCRFIENATEAEWCDGTYLQAFVGGQVPLWFVPIELFVSLVLAYFVTRYIDNPIHKYLRAPPKKK